MLPTPKNYAIWPSVVPADKPTEMTIAPTEKAFLFFENETYRVSVISVDDDTIDYYGLPTAKTFDVIAHGGVLRFTFAFGREQEHLIILEYGEKKLQELVIYSLKPDLYALRPLKGDLHSHSYRSDGRRDPAALAGHFREQGYDFFALTDHNRYYPGGEIDETYQGVKLGLQRVKGEEVHTPGSVVHIVHVGGKKSVAEQYIEDRAAYEAAIAAYEARVPATVPAVYKTRYAMARWACDRIHEAGGLAIFAHPFWRPGGSCVYNVCVELAKILLESGMFDAYELVGGMEQLGVNLSVALWADLRALGLQIPTVGSSDVHKLENASPDFPDHFTVCFARENENDAIIEAVKKGLCVAVEATGTEYERHYRCYGSFRLVSYAQYLLKYYFPQLQRICQGEGIAMRNYAMGDADAALIEGQAAQSRVFADRFFGRQAPALPSVDTLAFEEKWRAVHLQGPTTKGSHLDSEKVTRQI